MRQSSCRSSPILKIRMKPLTDRFGHKYAAVSTHPTSTAAAVGSAGTTLMVAYFP